MTSATGHSAVTIHRLLEYSFKKGGFQRNAARPLTCDLLIVDEASMIDTVLMYHLLQALPDGTGMVLVGDVDQLPSVGAGSVLRDMLASGTVPQTRLTRIFRQASASRIITNAHRINNGHLPELAAPDPRQDFFFIEQEDPQKVLDIILKLVGQRIPQRFGFDPVNEIQVLTPMHKGLIGADNLNQQLQQTLNPGENSLKRGGQTFRVGDKIMQIRNNYDKEVFNGDVGIISSIRPLDQELSVSFDGRLTTYSLAELDEIVLAYAISVHKSQGSEYSAVVMPILAQHYILLQRNLIYTAVTRGRNLVVMVGSRKALAMGIRNNRTRERHTFLKQRLQIALAPASQDDRP
jgi:exodeoxyribonuclease V alpha subunit